MAQAKVTVLLDMKSRLGGLNSAIGRVKALGSTLTRAILPLVGVGGAAGIGAGVRNIISLGAQMDHLRSQTGATVAGLLKLRQAFSDAGVEAGTAGKTINNLQRRIADAANGMGEGRQALRNLGLSATDLSRLSPEEQFEAVGNAIAGIEDPAQRTAIAVRLFSETGAKLMPVFGKGLDDARIALGRMPEILDRNATEFERIDTLIGRLPNKSRQLFAGLGDQLGGYLRGPLERLNEIDLTGMGQRIGAFISLGLSSVEDGTFTQFLNLAIRAGFEQGLAGGRQMMDAFWTGSGVVTRIVASLAGGIASLASDALGYLALFGSYATSAFVYAFEEAREGAQLLVVYLKVGFASAVNSFAAALETAINGVIDALRILPGMTSMAAVSIGRMVAPTTDEVKRARTYAEILKQSQEDVVKRADERRAAIEGVQRAAAGESIAEIENLGKVGAATEKLNALIRERIALKDREAAGSAPKALGAGMPIAANNFATTASNNYGSFMAGEGNAGVGTWDAAKAGLMDYVTTVGTVGQQIYASIGTIAQGLSGGISTSIQGLITETMTWGDALKNIATTFVQSIVTAFSDMAAQFVVKRMMMFVLNRKLDAADAASNVAKNAVIATSEATTATATAVAWTPAAILKSIATFGAAALIGIAILGAVLGGFAQGGYTGSGGTHEPAGVVHKGEFVFPAHVVDQIGVGNLYRMMANPASGYADGGAVGIATPTAVADRPVSVIVVDSRSQAERMMNDPDVEYVVKDIVQRNRADFFA
jgi:hypothetical protein